MRANINSAGARCRGAVAARGDDFNVYIRTNRDSGTEINPGTATLDEVFVQCSSDGGGQQWR